MELNSEQVEIIRICKAWVDEQLSNAVTHEDKVLAKSVGYDNLMKVIRNEPEDDIPFHDNNGESK